MTRNHKDTKTQRKPASMIVGAGFLCVFVSLWFLMYVTVFESLNGPGFQVLQVKVVLVTNEFHQFRVRH